MLFQNSSMDKSVCLSILSDFSIYNHGNKLSGQLRKTVLSMTPQAMYNQFKRPSVGSVREFYYIYRNT